MKTKEPLYPPVSKKEFVKLLNKLGRNKTAEYFGVQRSTVYKWAKALGLKSKKTIIWS